MSMKVYILQRVDKLLEQKSMREEITYRDDNITPRGNSCLVKTTF